MSQLTVTNPMVPLFLDKFKPWSYTKINVLKTCPKLFFSQQIIKDPATYQQNVDPATVQGKLLHSFMEEYFKGKLVKENFYSFVDSYRCPESIKLKVLKKLNDVHKLIDIINKTIKMQIRPDSVTKKIRLCPEFKVELTNNLTPTEDKKEVFYKVIMDLVARDEDTLIVIDHKSSTAKHMDAIKDQMMFYNIILAFKFPTVKRIVTYINDMRAVELKEVFTMDTKTLREQNFPIFKENLDALASKFSTMNKDLFIPVRSKMCDWCTLANNCIKE